ncbi:regulator of chromosome condensation 1/beta-lactamase-inhibitor protein II [Catenaria anguillulae PL171]|uniref:Regulator of chromosome condensation 1/beta-lactamase-inhibitor protein II n=1 Tax=Catenaria anguillulae PL171 TaxID=765915 RepID=A0A1Y2I4C5_9FUNG|nr:regulator of chromosome condensation 1/beta-lactamase-inhibitor protein II [Catenaria anguillulae PL171]
MDTDPVAPLAAAAAKPAPAPGAHLHKKRGTTLPKVKDADLPLPTRPQRPGNVLVMGNGDCGQLGLGEDVKSRFKYSFVKALKDLPIVALAAVYSWGCNDEGALETSNLGFTSDVRNARVPTLLSGPVFSRYRFVDVAAGNNHALALSSEGKVYAWGNVEQGQCGFKTHRPISALNPRGLKFGRGVKITAIACGGDHSLAIDADGDVWAFGLNNFGQCGKHPSVLKKAVAAAGGDHYSVVVLEDGSVATFGKAADAQLGERFFATVIAPTGAEARQEVPPHVYRPAQVPKLAGIHKVSAGANHVFALDKDHVAWRWGFNEMGQLGTGASANDEDATDDVREPLAMDMSKSRSEVLDVACGAQHSVILVYTPPKDE